jgi:hypothetical protein
LQILNGFSQKFVVFLAKANGYSFLFPPAKAGSYSIVELKTEQFARNLRVFE